MGDDFYFEETSSKRKFIILAIVLTILFGIAAYCYNKFMFRVKKMVVYEVGDTILYDLNVYVGNKIINKDDYVLILDSHINLEDDHITQAGVYDFTVKYKGTSKSGYIKVQDTKAPEVETHDLTVGLNEEFDPDEFITVCNEYSKPCNVSYKNSSDEELNKKEGTYKVSLVIKDKFDNTTNKDVNLTVKKDYSLLNEKINDLTPYRVYPDYNDWDKKSYVVKYAKAFDSNDEDNERLDYLYEMAEDDLSLYLPSEYADKTIDDAEIIFVYNKYNYIVGFAFRALLTDGTYVYLTNGE